MFIHREVLIERQWRGRSCRQECDFFWDQVNKHDSREEVPPIISNVNNYLISIYRDGNFLLVTTSEDCYALFVIEFLHRVYDVFEEYLKASRGSLGALGSLGSLTSLSLTGGGTTSDADDPGRGGSGSSVLDEGVIKDNFSVIYQLLEELLDFGFPLTTELNALKEIIEPPTLLTKLRGAVSSTTGIGGGKGPGGLNLGIGSPAGSGPGSGMGSMNRFSEPSPDGTLANMPWRKSNVVHAANEVFFDIVEELDCLVDDSANLGTAVSSSACGTIMCNSKLSGVPDLSLSLQNARAIADCSFHPCVRYTRFERDYTLSFVPPDGVFELMRYRVDLSGAGLSGSGSGSAYVAPLNCQAHIIWDMNRTPPTARLAVTLSHRAQCSLVTASIVSLSQSSGLSRTSGTGSSGSLFGMGADSDAGSSTIGMSKSKLPVEDIIVAIPLPPRLVQTLASVNVLAGTTLFDEHSKTLRWRVPKLAPEKQLQLNAVLSLRPVEHALAEPLGSTVKDPAHLTNASNSVFLTAAEVVSCHVQWKVPMSTLSGIAVQGLALVNENYKPFKGVRTLTKSGHMEIRMASILAT